MNFFQYYTEIKELKNPFLSFSGEYFFALFLVLLCMILFSQFIQFTSKQTIRRIEKGFITYFLIEELCYTVWILIKGPHNPLIEVLPLHLCSICIYTSIMAMLFDNEKLRRFVAINNLFGGIIAICYPANVSGIYPLLSYRVINFYLLHSALIMVALLQLKQLRYLRLQDLKFNMVILAVLAAIAMMINSQLHTDYLFVGWPPKISIIHRIYEVVGSKLYYPVTILVLFILECIVLCFINMGIYLYHQKKRHSIPQKCM